MEIIKHDDLHLLENVDSSEERFEWLCGSFSDVARVEDAGRSMLWERMAPEFLPCAFIIAVGN